MKEQPHPRARPEGSQRGLTYRRRGGGNLPANRRSRKRGGWTPRINPGVTGSGSGKRRCLKPRLSFRDLFPESSVPLQTLQSLRPPPRHPRARPEGPQRGRACRRRGSGICSRNCRSRKRCCWTPGINPGVTGEWSGQSRCPKPRLSFRDLFPESSVPLQTLQRLRPSPRHPRARPEGPQRGRARRRCGDGIRPQIVDRGNTTAGPRK
jgi:hypothetical protein